MAGVGRPVGVGAGFDDDGAVEGEPVDLTGVFHTLRAVVPQMVDHGAGRVITIASMGGRAGTPNLGHYAAAKWGVMGLTKTLALETAGPGATANAVCPGTVSTDMVHNPARCSLFAPDLPKPATEQARARYARMNPMGVPWSEAGDITGAVLDLASDDARHRKTLEHEHPAWSFALGFPEK